MFCSIVFLLRLTTIRGHARWARTVDRFEEMGCKQIDQGWQYLHNPHGARHNVYLQDFLLYQEKLPDVGDPGLLSAMFVRLRLYHVRVVLRF